MAITMYQLIYLLSGGWPITRGLSTKRLKHREKDGLWLVEDDTTTSSKNFPEIRDMPAAGFAIGDMTLK